MTRIPASEAKDEDQKRFHHLLRRAAMEGYRPASYKDTSSTVVLLADLIIGCAIRHHASDIHIEATKHDVRLRYRIDGILYRWFEPIPSLVGEKLASRFKVMGGMDSAQRTKPLDGSISFPLPDEGHIDIRVSTLPSVYGENIVLRLMNLEEKLLSLDDLDFSDTNLALVRKLVHRPSGLVILTGPMNSGKTTTLYAALSELNDPASSLLSLEDPIERKIDGVCQVQINEKAGFDYMTGLRAALRQDAEKILLGEIRDADTAEMAVRIALTGHLLMTSLHASSAVSVIYRMLEMDIEPYLLAETMEGIIAQRLVRRLCPYCHGHSGNASGIEPSAAAFSTDEPQQTGNADSRNSCPFCHDGFMGRMALHEVLPITSEIRELIRRRAPRDDMEEAARRAGMKELAEDGHEKVLRGLTTQQEVRRVLYGNDENL